ncbi:hypothetical protein [Roseinatronobacter alkalisoli]|nr:hypothetical protein [Roseinatronobacter sp. HJB301]
MPVPLTDNEIEDALNHMVEKGCLKPNLSPHGTITAVDRREMEADSSR